MDPFTGLPTLRHDLSIDRGMSFDAACARLAHERSGEGRARPVSMATVRRTCADLGCCRASAGAPVHPPCGCPYVSAGTNRLLTVS